MGSELTGDDVSDTSNPATSEALNGEALDGEALAGKALDGEAALVAGLRRRDPEAYEDGERTGAAHG